MPSWFCQHLFIVFGVPGPPAEGFLSPLFQSLFSYSWLSENKARKAAHTQCSLLDKFFLYGEKAVVLSHPFASRKTSQLEKPDTESNGLKEGEKHLIFNGGVAFCSKDTVAVHCFGVSRINLVFPFT